MVVTVWKEAGFFMIFYLAALQSMSPHLAEAAAIEGASRWYFFRRVTFPLLMPTTLFVLVNAVINAFRLVDHVVVMTRGGPDNATALLLYYVYEIGFRFWDSAYAAALTMVLLALLGLRRARAVLRSSSAGCTTNERRHRTSTSRAASARALETVGAWLLGLLWVLPLAVRVLDGVPSGRVLDALRADRAADARELREGLGRGAVRALLPQHRACWSRWCWRRSSCWCTLAAYAFARFEFPGRNVLFALVLVQLMVMPDVLIVENYRTMTALGLEGHDPRDRPAVHGERVRHLPAAPDVQDGAARARRGRARRGLRRRCRCCGRSTCRSRGPSISPTRWSASATTGTISCGRSSSPIRSSRGR